MCLQKFQITDSLGKQSTSKASNKQAENKKSTMKWCVVIVQRTKTILWITWDKDDTVITVAKNEWSRNGSPRRGQILMGEINHYKAAPRAPKSD